MRFIYLKFTNLLYSHLSFAYDFVAKTISYGKWYKWVETTENFLHGNSILELGIGTGYFQTHLIKRNPQKLIIGIDKSVNMLSHTKKRMQKQKITGKKHFLIHGTSQLLPFANNTFSSVVATFPTNYIFLNETLDGILRVLEPQGHLIILLSSWPTTNSIQSSVRKLIYSLTGHSQKKENKKAVDEIILVSSSKNALLTKEIIYQYKDDQLLFLVAKKIPRKASQLMIKY